MGEIRVDPPSLEASGSNLAAAGDETTSLAGVVEGAESAAEATGDPVAAAAYGHMCQVWATELFGLGEELSEIGANAMMASVVYQATDEVVMPAGGDDG